MIECDAQKSAPILREYVRAIPVTRPYFNAKPGDVFAAPAPNGAVFVAKLDAVRPGDVGAEVLPDDDDRPDQLSGAEQSWQHCNRRSIRFSFMI